MKIRYALFFFAVVLLGFLSGAADPRLADAAPPRCEVQVTVHEDGSYSGTNVFFDGRLIAERWIVTAPRWQGQTWRSRPGQVTANVDWNRRGPVFRGNQCGVYGTAFSGG